MRYKIVLFLNVVIFLIISVISLVLAKNDLPRVNLVCRYDKGDFHKKFTFRFKDTFKIKRNPFFYPVKDVNVKMVKVDVNTEQVAKQASFPIVYKGMVTWSGEKIAIFFIRKDKKTKFVKLGGFVAGYKVLDINEDEVVLSKKEGLSIITLKIGGMSD